MFRIAANDRDEDILMIQYETETNAIPRMIRWNETFSVPLVDQSNTHEHTGTNSFLMWVFVFLLVITGTMTHPLLVSRSSFESNQNSSARNQRTNRPRRYQYVFSPRNPNPPVILQR